MKTEQKILKEIEDNKENVLWDIKRGTTLKTDEASHNAFENILNLEKAKSKLEGYQLAQKETAEKVEKLKEAINNPKMEDKLPLNTLIDKIFKETEE